MPAKTNQLVSTLTAAPLAMAFGASCALTLPGIGGVYSLPIEISRVEKNTDVISFEELSTIGANLTARHIAYLSDPDTAPQLTISDVRDKLGEKAQLRLRTLTNAQIKFKLYGDVEVIPNPEQLGSLGGIEFTYQDMKTKGALEPSLHSQTETHGPDREIVVIYALKDGKVIHFNYPGVDDVDGKDRKWQLLRTLQILAKGASKVVKNTMDGLNIKFG